MSALKPLVLDLYCGVGGASRGYQAAGFRVRGVDINPQPNYCGDEFVQADSIVDPCSAGYCPTVVQGPTDDGSFGGDEGGIYFFTDTGMEVQWNGRWLLTDEPLKIQTPTLTLTQK